MPVDKRTETIAVRHCCNIHYHRCLVLEGVRRAVLRNVGRVNEEQPGSIIDAGAARLFGKKYRTPVTVIEQDLTRICRDMFRIFMDSLWEVYLCLLHEEFQAYKKLIGQNSKFEYAPLTDFLRRHRNLLKHLQDLRDAVLHPESRTSTEDAIEGIFSPARSQNEPLPKLIVDAQFLLDAHTVRFWFSMGSYFVTEGDKEIANNALEAGSFSRIEKLNRIAKAICYQPLPHWPNPSDLRGNPSQVQLLTLGLIQDLKSSQASRPRQVRKSYPHSIVRAKRGCMQMIMRALAFYNEFTAYVDPEKLLACPVDPSKDMSIDINQFFRADKAPKTVQEHQDQQALLRVTLGLLYKPLKLYKHAAKQEPLLQVPQLDSIVNYRPDFEALKSLRNSVFHVPRGNVDFDSRDLEFMHMSMPALKIFEPLMNFYNDCP